MTLVATAPSTGATIQDRVRMISDSQHLAGRQPLCVQASDAANDGAQLSITASDITNWTITLDPPLPAPVKTGDVFEVYNRASQGFTIDELASHGRYCRIVNRRDGRG